MLVVKKKFFHTESHYMNISQYTFAFVLAKKIKNKKKLFLNVQRYMSMVYISTCPWYILVHVQVYISTRLGIISTCPWYTSVHVQVYISTCLGIHQYMSMVYIRTCLSIYQHMSRYILVHVQVYISTCPRYTSVHVQV